MADEAPAQQPQVQTQGPPQGQPQRRLEISSVSGGAGGTYAMLEEIQALAKLSEEVGAGLAIIRSQCHDVVIDGDVLMSAVLNPAGIARFEATLLDAIDGPGGLMWLSAELQAHGPLLRKAAEAYRALDEGSEALFDSVAWAAGYAGVGIGLGAGAAVIASLLNPFTAPFVLGGGYLAGTQVDWNRVLRDNPALVQGIIRSLPGVVAAGQVAVRLGLGTALGPAGVALGPLVTGPIVTDVQSGAKWVGGFYPDGEPVVRRATMYDPTQDTAVPLIETDPRITTAPKNFDDLFNAYDYRNGRAQELVNGEIDVREITKDGKTVYVVNLPGTYAKATNPLPLQQYETLNDMSTNIHAMAGEQTAYGEGVAQALRNVNYQAGSEIMVVGHSQGGIVAAQLASDPQFRKDFNVTHVVTAGSPIGNYQIPPGVKVVSFENNGDPIPKLDGRDNPAQSNWTTVKINSPQEGSLINNHGFTDVYRPVGSYLDSSTDPSVKAFRESADDFLNGTEVKNNVLTIRRNVP